MATPSNRSTGDAFRAAVARFIEIRTGLQVNTRAKAGLLLSEMFGNAEEDNPLPGDLVGLRRFAVAIRANRVPLMTESMTAATTYAAGTDRVPVGIFWRQSAPLGKQYVVMELDGFADLVADLQVLDDLRARTP